MKKTEIQELCASFGIVTSFLSRGSPVGTVYVEPWCYTGELGKAEEAFKRIRGWVNHNIRPADV